MDISAIKKMYTYHFGMHRKVWDDCISTLTDEQFIEELVYSKGSIRNQCVHLIGVDERWFARLKGEALPDFPSNELFTSKASVRARWDDAEKSIMAHLNTLTNADMIRLALYDMPHRGGMKSNMVWEILVHVINHGTDHRAQILAMLHQMGAPTLEQDMMLYWWE
ncbi:MAG: DinB family protein [Phototrophicales bacterium]|nr:DinB family protein [Phototrophicales bacterium]